VKVPLKDQQASYITADAPPEAKSALKLLTRRLLEERARRLKAEQEAGQDGSSGE
jgi:hypothetical protein